MLPRDIYIDHRYNFIVEYTRAIYFKYELASFFRILQITAVENYCDVKLITSEIIIWKSVQYLAIGVLFYDELSSLYLGNTRIIESNLNIII